MTTLLYDSIQCWILYSQQHQAEWQACSYLSAGQEGEKEELATALLEWCASLEMALREVTGQLAASRASEAALRRKIGILLTGRGALAAR